MSMMRFVNAFGLLGLLILGSIVILAGLVLSNLFAAGSNPRRNRLLAMAAAIPLMLGCLATGVRHHVVEDALRKTGSPEGDPVREQLAQAGHRVDWHAAYVGAGASLLLVAIVLGGARLKRKAESSSSADTATRVAPRR